jgi:hypothetical protein
MGHSLSPHGSPRSTFQQFLRERTYINNVTTSTRGWYECAWKAFKLAQASAPQRPASASLISKSDLQAFVALIDGGKIFGIEMAQSEPFTSAGRRNGTAQLTKAVASAPAQPAAQAHPKTPTSTRRGSAKKRAALSARMKAYWRDRRERGR